MIIRSLFGGVHRRSVKYEQVYLHAYDTVSDTKAGLYFARRNPIRPYSSLDGKTPNEFYFDNPPALPKTAQALTARLTLRAELPLVPEVLYISKHL